MGAATLSTAPTRGPVGNPWVRANEVRVADRETPRVSHRMNGDLHPWRLPGPSGGM